MRTRTAVRGGILGAFIVAGVVAHESSLNISAEQTPSVAGRAHWAAQPPLPQGQRIDAQDGDTIVLDGDARVRIVRRRQGRVRAVFISTQRRLIFLVDYPPQNSTVPDARVDESYSFEGISPDWPLEERWEGDAVVEDYSTAGQGGPPGYGFRTPQGLVQLLGSNAPVFQDSSAIAVLSFNGFGRGSAGGVSFDEAEQHQVAMAGRNAQTNARSWSSAGGVSAGVSMSVEAGAQPQNGPLRVGGTIGMPQKTYDVAPVLPEPARQAAVRGVVILELTIGVDGAVTRARVLRSIPILDGAALEAARQWRYEPVLLNGKPVEVILTAPVTFQ